jgi:hypothetical protein
MSRKYVLALFAMIVLAAAAGWSQETAAEASKEVSDEKTAASPESDELTEIEKKEIEAFMTPGVRFKTWSEFVEWWTTPRPFAKERVVPIDENYAYPHVVASTKMLIVREDEKYIWLRGAPPEDPNSPLYRIWARREAQQAVSRTIAEMASKPGAKYYLNFSAEDIPPAFMESLTFVPVADNLPTDGRWQMGFAAADMNKDGHVDLVFPPRRKTFPARPVIFLGDGKGGFEVWDRQKWPDNVQWDYGDVEIADFDGDGHQDAAFAVHFKPQYILYGDSNGVFARGEQLPSPNPRISSRAVTVADFDGDGRQDLAFVAEVDYDITSNQRFEGAVTVWALLNRGVSSWELSNEGLAKNLIADNIRASDVDGDGRPEIVVSSNSNGFRHLVFSYRGDDGWQALDHRGVLSSAYHYDVEPSQGEVFSTFVQFRMIAQEAQALNGIVRYPVQQGDQEIALGSPIVREKERKDVFYRLALGDVDGDGDTDLVASRRDSGLEVYLQTPEGLFYREKGTELDAIGRAFDIQLVDLDGDGRDDIVTGCAPQGDRPGGVFVWLSKPTV